MSEMAVEERSRADGIAALHSTAGLRALAAELGGIGVPMLVLKGPLLQERLYGTRLGIACLARSVVVARMLRSRGVGATVSLSVAADAPRSAHAEVAVGKQPLRPHPGGNVLFI